MEFAGKKKRIIAAGVAAAALVGGCAAYWGMAQKYQNVFFPNTIINGLNVSNCTVDQIQEEISSALDEYTLILEERGGTEETISGVDFDLHPQYDGTLEQILLEQNPLEWAKGLTGEIDYTIDTMLLYDKEKLKQTVNRLKCLNPTATDQPKDAHISDYIEGVGYQIVPDEPGKALDGEKLLEVITDAITNMKPRISLEEADVYKKADILPDNEALNAQLDMLNRYVNTTVTYKFGDKSETLDGNTIHTWIMEDGSGGVTLDEALIGEYVAGLAKKYNTAYSPKQLKTSYGTAVTITRGNYGWRINQSAETAALLQIIQSGEGQEREPVYSQTAASHGENDYGNTYVEINLSAQHLFFYKNGSLLVESDFVSGNESRGWSTPAGAYPLTYKQRDATLKGEGYATPVSYWMPFNGGIGMHDATWRGSFGGKIYKTNGSHGCINLPKSAAKTIFENISAGVPVLCYHLENTASSATTAAAATQAPPVTTAAPVLETSVPAETTAAPEETAPPMPEEEPQTEATQPGYENQGPGVTQTAAETAEETTQSQLPVETEQPEETQEASSEPTTQAQSQDVPTVGVQEGPGGEAAQNGENTGPGM